MGSNESPTWSPDSRHVMFHSSRTGRAQLYTATLETGVVRMVPNLGHLTCEGPSWGPRRQ
jgi:Tol biopolymer transport system component